MDCEDTIDDGCTPTTLCEGFPMRTCALLLSMALLCACPKTSSETGGEGEERPGDGCSSDDASVYPGAPEICDGLDNDCDGETDEEVLLTWYWDGDGDGFGDVTKSTSACSAPDGYTADTTDCDDRMNQVHPGATEACDGIDNDCDGETDEPDSVDALTWYTDGDGDGYGDAGSSVLACALTLGIVADSTDCDDADPTVWPGADESCNGRDDDCDDEVDEGVQSTYYEDADGDGAGQAETTMTACEPPPGYAATPGDCNDTDPTTWTGADELCGDHVDNDCDRLADELPCGLVPPTVTLLSPEDDAIYSEGEMIEIRALLWDDEEECDSLWLEISSDMPDDSYSPEVMPDFFDIAVDDFYFVGCELIVQTHYLPPVEQEIRIEVEDPFDNIASAALHLTVTPVPPTVEVLRPFEGETLTEGDSFTFEARVTDVRAEEGDDSWYDWSHSMDVYLSPAWEGVDSTARFDGDIASCEFYNAPVGDTIVTFALEYTRDVDPYHDLEVTATLHVEATDGDGDGFTETDGDCDDEDGTVFLGAPEYCGVVSSDRYDRDCDGTFDEAEAVDAVAWYKDADRDGWGDAGTFVLRCDDGFTEGAWSYVPGDCDDGKAAIHPYAEESCASAVDYNCDGSGGNTDADGDGHLGCMDCDDTNPSIYEHAPEYCDGLDHDCDEAINESDSIDAVLWYMDADGDGYGDPSSSTGLCDGIMARPWTLDASDCNDGLKAVHPGAEELCNGLDEDCDAMIDEDCTP